VPRREQIPLLVYGASREGQMLADGLMRQGRYRPVAFIDTDYTVVDRLVCGLKVYSSETLDQVLDKHRARVVVIAKPDQNRAQRRAAVDMFLDRGLEVKTMPGLEEIADGKVDVTALRPIHLADLLGRDPVPPDRALMEHAVRDKVVMVTGAGGSIGSELVRQIKPLAPRKIVMVDESEFFLFEINRDMEGRKSASGSTTTLVAVLADIRDRQRMEEIMAEHQVDMVLHAAAYKHVRMVQENATAGIRNNVWGTLALAEAAIAQGVERFVMISTDKAVRPTSVMGASKRVAEMVIQALAARTNSKTVFTMVRFGNVLGSTGSVVPLFTEQIAKGGPVLVTHPEVTRYFMLIPEAAQLVIQAGAMAKGGEVFVLNMGESIKIVQLAETMIELAGLTRRSADNPDGDIEIKFIGLRDGEKLYEELQIGRDVALTSHPRIMKSHEYWMKWEELSRQLKELDRRLRGNDREAGIALLFELASRDR
jgi:FlaA1/EpsC-like NDP-sugar epimerase